MVMVGFKGHSTQKPPTGAISAAAAAATSTATATVKILCSYGGKILPRHPDGKLRYLGGHTRVLAVDRSISFAELLLKLRELCGCGGGSSVSFRCQLPTEDLDALVSIKSDEDLANLIEEYDRFSSGSNNPYLKIRAFLFVPRSSHHHHHYQQQRAAKSSPSPPSSPSSLSPNSSISPSSSLNAGFLLSPRNPAMPVAVAERYIYQVPAQGNPVGRKAVQCVWGNAGHFHLVRNGFYNRH